MYISCYLRRRRVIYISLSLWLYALLSRVWCVIIAFENAVSFPIPIYFVQRAAQFAHAACVCVCV